ncbi:MAG: hypothetical protein ACPLXM_10915 [Bacteroidales bacterium]|nr:hypothetical protein [Bacteroidales bacterium]
MKYLPEILWLLSWPAMILVSYWLIQYVLKLFEKKEQDAVPEK